jgi:hypothetical protein
MSDGSLPFRLTRRHFLSGLAVAGAWPLWHGADGLAWPQAAPAFTGDDFELAHRLLLRPDDILAQGTPQADADLYDTIVVGAGIAGLVAAYRLRTRHILVLERDAEIGGVSKSASWQGIEYALGAAYILDPDPDSDDPREKLGYELLEELDLRRRGEAIDKDRRLQRRLSGDANHCVFSTRRVVPEAEIYTARNRRFFEAVLDSDRYPSVPVEDEALAEALDRVSFKAFLRDAALQRKIYDTTVGTIPRLGWEALEYYCWGAFGTSAAETSAYHGLNFFVAEFGDILVYPGGNAFIARRLGDRIRRDNARALHTGAWTLRVAPDAGTYAVTTWENGSLRRYRARSVIFAAPLFLAPTVVPSLPEPQRKAIGALEYRSYVVANVLLRRPANAIFASPAFRNGYELTRVHGFDLEARSVEAISTDKVYSDAILADFPTGRHPTHAVLTVYRPYPYAAGRAELMGRSYEEIDREVRREVLAGFGPHGLRAADIESVQICRWGHPMIVTRPGLLADGTLRLATRSQPGLYFAHTDVMGAPAYENAIAAAHDAVEAVTAHLAKGA